NNYQLRIYYLNAETEGALANAYIATIPYGQTYSVTSPVITGWTCQTPVVEGTMGAGDTEIDVYYVRDVHNVTVHYVDGEGAEMAPDYTGTCGYGLTYSAESPVIPGYTASQAVVSGTMGTEDVEVTVTYTAIPYTVTIHYVDAEGNPVADDYVETYVIGDEYAVVSPAIEGYTPDQGTVSGTIGTENVEVTVIYTPVVNGITIHYVFADGTTAADDYTAELAYGEAYSVASPAITGYTADVTVVEGTMGTEPIVVTVTYTANVHRLTIYYLDAETEMALANGYFADYAYGDEYSVVSPVIEGYTADILVVEGTMGDEDVTVEVHYTKNFVPTPPTVEGEHAELRERPTADGKSDLRFIFKVTFNDSFIVNGGQTYGPTTDYYEITRFYIVLQATGNPMTIEGREIYTMADDSFEFTAVLKGIKADYNSVSITAKPTLEVTMNGETIEVTCDPLVSSVDEAAAYND
ncbi:MAG: MucBP domain-containing protein, partial [Clostridia bacterium]|nr:MucBP domain-containing protein [Clostridia bacterium]